MKLFFNKNEKGDIVVKMQKGSEHVEFDYILMLTQLIEDNNIEEPEFQNIEEEEKAKINELLSKIHNIVQEAVAPQQVDTGR